MCPPRLAMAHLPCLLALPFLFLGFHVLPSHGSPLPRTYDGSMCSESFMCGSVNISYPFYLSNATKEAANYTPYSCGYTDLKISCQGEGETKTPIIQLDGDSYTVLSISYSSYTIQNISYNSGTISLADTDALGHGNDCPRVRHNATFGTEWLHYTGSSDNLTFFFGCPPPSSDRWPPPNPGMDMHQINCSGFKSPGGGVSFVFVSEEHELPEEHELAEYCAEYCSQVFVAPVIRDPLMKSNKSMLASGGYGTLLRRGFELAWNRSTTDRCYLCEEADGRCSYSKNRDFLGCLCRDGKVGISNCPSSSSSTAPPPPRDSKKRRKIYIIAIASTSGILLLCLLFLAFLMGSKKYRFKKRSKETPRIESFLQKNRTLHPKRYTYAQVKRMTNSFAEKLGQGGFGVVYRGDLSDGHQIAVKMLKDSKADGEEFINEVASISKTSHVNVVTLLGFCLEGSKRALIYDYMPNGSLERYAFNENSKGENTLSWEKLFDIAVGIARGLEYLHRGCNTRIVHFDIKPHNILLDQDFCPKISDFGLAKLCLNKESAVSIGCARGTIGYIAPEVYSKQFGAVSSKSDVYSYGMMVLEMVGARDKNTNANSESSSQYFPQWIYEHLDEYCVSASEINGEITEIVRKMIVVGLWCIQVIPTNRPTMTRVVEMLEGSTSGLELPPKVQLT